jgi:hypothetical protein
MKSYDDIIGEYTGGFLKSGDEKIISASKDAD